MYLLYKQIYAVKNIQHYNSVFLLIRYTYHNTVEYLILKMGLYNEFIICLPKKKGLKDFKLLRILILFPPCIKPFKLRKHFFFKLRGNSEYKCFKIRKICRCGKHCMAQTGTKLACRVRVHKQIKILIIKRNLNTNKNSVL